MKSVLKYFASAVVIVSFAGCYTELSTIEHGDRDISYESDTTYDDDATTINNHYYLDDEYRQSRLRVSFNYYYPSYSSRISSYYYSYFNDYSWGMYHRPSWYYDPFYSYYPSNGWCYYPSPIYDPWFPYYPPYVYYPVYYSSPVYANNPATPGRPRPGGSTRDPVPENRPRPNPTSSPVTGSAVSEHSPTESMPIATPRGGRDRETPWWDKISTERPSQNTDAEARPIDTENKPARDNRTTPSSGSDGVRHEGEARPVERPKDDRSVQTPPKKERPARDDKPVERPRKNTSTYTPPVKQSPPKQEARPVERPRESRKPSYTPPPRQSAAPQSAPSRSGSGSSSSGNNGRKRD